MSALTVDDIGSAGERPKSRSWLWRHGADLCLGGLFVLTAATISFQHQLFGRDIVISHATSKSYILTGYADQTAGGKSTFKLASRPLDWSCDLKPGWRWLYCGFEVVLDRDGAMRGADLRKLDSVAVALDYRGPAKTLRLFLKNEDPRYSKHGDRTTAKVNKVEFSLRNGPQTLVFRPQDFSVADWWLSGKNLTPELERAQLDNVVSVELTTGSGSPAGHYSFALKSLTLKRSAITPAQLYLIIIAGWALVIALYVAFRVRRARRDASEKESAQAEARVAMAAAKEAAERASKAKSDFLANMSHELRTPLNAVLGYAQLLERADLSEEHLSAVQTIHRSGDHLLSLITDLLDLSKVEAGKMELNRASTDLRALIASVVEMIGVRAEEKGIAFDCVVDEGAPDAVEADEKRLRQILLNLLSNAVKFTTQGGVALSVSVVDRDAAGVAIRFAVQDSGPGIPDDELERIFRPFEQVGDLQRREGGTGLGLAISRQLATLMGGVIGVQSRVGEGTRFWLDVRLPVAELQVEAQPAPAAALSGDGAPRDAERPLRILAAEDNPTNQMVLRAVLRDLDVDLHLVSNGAEALKAFQDLRFDVVLMDVQMPELDGVQATQAIRGWEAARGRARTPIIALSANVMTQHIAEYRAAGMDGHLDKPIDVQQLYGMLEKVSAGGLLDADSPVAAPHSRLA